MDAEASRREEGQTSLTVCTQVSVCVSTCVHPPAPCLPHRCAVSGRESGKEGQEHPTWLSGLATTGGGALGEEEGGEFARGVTGVCCPPGGGVQGAGRQASGKQQSQLVFGWHSRDTRSPGKGGKIGEKRGGICRGPLGTWSGQWL